MKMRIKLIPLMIIGLMMIVLFITMGEDRKEGKVQKKTYIEKPKDNHGASNVEISKEDVITVNIDNKFTYGPLPQEIIGRISGVSWKPESPVQLEELSYLKVSYWGFDGKEHQGELIVLEKIGKEVADIFQELYDIKFPIEKIKLIDEYGGDDDLSMADNNTSAFCFREVADKQGVLSKHSYGIAIDINPVQNPYIKEERVSPLEGENYLNRSSERMGMIVKDSLCYSIFKQKGWNWGGDWKTLKDYQHFEKTITIE